VSLAIVGNPATGPWGVNATTTITQDVMAHVRLDGVMQYVENHAPYGFPGDNGATVTPGLFGIGTHTVEFVFYLQGTTTEIERVSVTVQEGARRRLPWQPRRLQAIHDHYRIVRPVGC
jgi:hypothetical protein